MRGRWLALAGIIGCGSPTTAPGPPLWDILVDRSDGMQDASGRACQAVGTIARHLLTSPKRTKDATLRLYQTGSRDGVGQRPLFTSDLRDVICGGGLEGCSAKDAQAKADALVDAITAACRAGSEPIPYSPLHAGLSALVGDLRAACTQGRTCEVYFYTDLVDTQEPWICTEMLGADAYGHACPKNVGAETRVDGKAGFARPSPVDATGVGITICGMSASTDAAAHLALSGFRDRREEVWRDLYPNATGGLRFLSDCGAL